MAKSRRHLDHLPFVHEIDPDLRVEGVSGGSPSDHPPEDAPVRMDMPSLGTIDHFDLHQEYPRDDGASVFAAWDRRTSREVGLKALPPLVRKHLEELARIQHAVEGASRLEHPHIGRVRDLHRAHHASVADRVREVMRGVEGNYLAVMDFAPGEPLDRWLAGFPEGRAPFATAREVAAQIADALDYAHGQGVAHLDVQPARILVESQEDQPFCRVTEFGLGSELRASLGRITHEVALRPEEIPYVAPEHWQHRAPGPPADQYALAVMLHTMLTGQVPPDEALMSPDPGAALAEAAKAAGVSGVPASAWPALARGLETGPGNRFPSCQALVDALTAPPPPPPAPSPPQKEPQPSRPARPEPPPARPRRLRREEALQPTRTPMLEGGGAPPKRTARRAVAILALAVLVAGTGLGIRFGLRGRERAPDVTPEPPVVESPEQQRAQAARQVAEAARVRLAAREIDRGQGFGVALDRLDRLVAEAETLWQRSDYDPAAAGFERVAAGVSEIEAEEAKRAGARTLRTAARGRRDRVVGIATLVPEAWDRAEREWSRAEEAFASGEFDVAVSAYRAAAAGFTEAGEEGDRILARQRQEEEERLAREQAERERLAREEAEREARAREEERLARERAERDRLAREQAEREALSQEEARLAREQAEREAASQARAETRRGEARSGREAAAEREAETWAAAEWSRAEQALARADAAFGRNRFDAAAEGYGEAAAAYAEAGQAAQAAREARRRQEERERLAREQAERDRLAREQAERERAEREEHERRRQVEEEAAREAARRAEAEREAEARAAPTYRLPRDLRPAPDAAQAPLDGLAEGSEAAQIRQRQAAEALELPVEVVTARVGIRLRLVPAGTATRGSPPGERGRQDDEFAHTVRITRPFFAGTFEVTQAEWEAVMGTRPWTFREAGPRAPVENVTWEEAQAFLDRLCEREGVPRGTYRLLTEAEWEYAARAGTAAALATGDLTSTEGTCPRLDRAGWYLRNSGQTVRPVGEKAPNAWGLHDMHGNVMEWCADVYGPYPRFTATNPAGPDEGPRRVVRGGSWADHPAACRSADRQARAPDFRWNNLGFRIARTVTPP